MITLHHTGFVVKSIDNWEKNMVYESKVNDVIDNIQNARLSLYRNFGGGFIELIQPLNDNAFTMNSLVKFGNHFNHFCYSVNSIDEMNQFASSFNLISVLGPTQAILFDNKQVAFFYNRNRQIVEFLIEE